MRALFRDEWRGRPYLLSPALDMFLAGGGALFGLLLLIAFIPYDKKTPEDILKVAYVAGAFGALGYFVNMPHFMSSYQLLYGNFRRRLAHLKGHKEMWWRTFNASVVVPVALAALLVIAGFAAARGDMSWLTYSVHVMFFFVGWHYAKQAFGIFIMLSALKGVFYKPEQRRILLVNAYTVWLTSWAYMSYTNKFLGVAFQSGFTGTKLSDTTTAAIEMPAELRFILLAFALCTTLASALMLWKQSRASGIRPSTTALTAYLSMYYLWAFMAVLHPEWALAVPFFHSLQYLMFVAAYKRGELNTGLSTLVSSEDRAKKEKRLRHRTQEFFGWAFLLGLTAFIVIPYGLTQALEKTNPLLPPGVFFLLAVIFINVHHYFIDNVLWRKENENVSHYLLGWRKNRVNGLQTQP